MKTETEHDGNDECFQAREAGLALSQDVESLSARLTGSSQSSVDSAQRLAKEVGVLSDVRTLPMMQCAPREVELLVDLHFV